MTSSADGDDSEADDDISAALAEELERVADELGQPPTKSQFDEHSQHNPQTFVTEFGSWVAALRAADLDPSDAQGGPKKATEAELKAELERLAEDLERSPQVADMNARGEYSAHTYKKRFGSWNAALTEVGLEPETVAEVSREELKAELDRLADELGHPPRTEHMDTVGEYSSSTYQSRFGGWQDALDAAGFDPFVGISEEELLAAVRGLAEELGRPPTTDEFNDETPHSATTCKEKFGSWRETLVEAGLNPSDREQTEYTDAELIEELQRLAESLGHTPSTSEMNDDGKFSAGVYQHRFGSWEEALDAADLDASEAGRQQYSNDDLEAEMQGVADEVGHAPRTADMEEHGDISPATFTNRFGSWEDAVKEAGFNADESATGKQYTDEELVAELQRLADKLGHPPTTTEMNSDGEFSAGVYLNRFESWGDALEVAGLDADTSKRGQRYTDDELLAELRRLASELGRQPTTTEMEERGKYAYATYTSRFGSWEKALDAAGVSDEEE